LRPRLLKSAILVLTVVAACEVAGVIAVQAHRESQSAHHVRLRPVDSGVNADGQRYGSAFANGRPTHVDLVAAMGDHDIAGYVRETDLDAGPSTLADVEKAEADGTLAGQRTISLVAKDGHTVLDTFTLR
jgi:hypothetical protein